MMDTYRKVINPSAAGANLRFTYMRYTDNHSTDCEIYAEYLLREDGWLFGRGSRVYCENSAEYTSLDDFTLLDKDIADIDDCYLLKRDGGLYCIYPGKSKIQRILVPEQKQSSELRPVKVMDNVKQHIHSHPNDFVLLQDGTVCGWGLNWRRSLGAGLSDENISLPVFVTDHAVKLIRGDTLYQTYALKENHSIWCWSPAHGLYKPVLLVDHVSNLAFLPHDNTILLNDEGELYRAALNESSTVGCQRKLAIKEMLHHDISSVQFSQFLIAAVDKEGAMFLWHLPLSEERPVRKLSFMLPDIVQYITASDSVIALDNKGSLYLIHHYYIGNDSELLVECLAEEISAIDSVISGGIEVSGAYVIDRNDRLLELKWTFSRCGTAECTCRIIFEDNVLQTAGSGQFVVCKDGSVWER